MLSSSVLSILAVAGSASALVIRQAATAAPLKMQWPTTRGNTADTQSIGPCQGFSANSSKITDFPITGGKLAFTQTGVIEDVQISFSALAAITDVSLQSSFEDLLPEVDEALVGHHCYIAPDFESFGTQVGQNVTIQVEYTNPTTGRTGYECADVHLVEVAAFTATVSMCFNATTGELTPTESDNATSTSDSTASNTATIDEGGLSNAAAGGIGASVGIVFTLALVALVFGALYKSGKVLFGKKAVAAHHVPVASSKKLSSDVESN
ncbi:hypothetical protein BDY24DRAFT_379793 [Mrakia frigida]|uniref:copper acquisition factor BIM1-like domain-containing protein n=1 Tax=Mrakia frigida TaxID=29902 RepID=UPI003FCC0D4B